ncbi:uncharacterized protein LOC125054309 [Pieris napi]|uniref:uncharacterized protein LOC125054309 n=1 Tax=Pieris napi TaxID=78633 RepID=UPI001FB93A51|nr:uncharacterized protein LOC125054309 [Pieris napi]
MDAANTHNQNYWFVVRDDHRNVIFSSNNFTIQNPQSQEARFIVDAGVHSENRQYVQVQDNIPPVLQEETPKEIKETVSVRDDIFWDRNKVQLLLTLCLQNGYNPSTIEQIEWTEIAALLGTTPEECDKKFRGLRRIYLRLMKKKNLGKDIKWKYFNICEEFFKDCKLSFTVLEPWEDSKIRQLLSIYIENINKFRDPNYLHKDVWKEIASRLETTEYNCYHKFKSLKRTYLNWLQRSRETGKLIKWTYHQYFERIYYNYNPDLGPWDRNKIRLLINAYAEIAHMFKNPKYQKKELWREISRKVGESPSSCDRKFRNLKQTYLRLKMRVDTGRSVTKWKYYKEFSTIFENEAYSVTNDGQQIVYRVGEQDYVKELLNFYLDNKEKFWDPLVKKKPLWRTIASKIGLTAGECDKKFRNLKQTYLRMAERKQLSGKSSTWPYYSYFEKIYDQPKLIKKECKHACMDNVTLKEITSIVKDVHEIKGKDKFERLVKVIEDSNNIQRERNRILQALLDRK